MSIIAKAIEYLNKETGNNYICEIIDSPNNELEYNNQVKFFLEEPNNNELVLINQKPYSWLQIQSKLNKAEFDIKLQFLRIERNKLLSQTDWHITKAKENNEEIPANIKTYRQQLRDITEGLSTIEQVKAVVFPVKA